MTNEAAGCPTLGTTDSEKNAAVQQVVSADIETAMKPVNVEDNAFIPVGGLTMSEEEKKLVSPPRIHNNAFLCILPPRSPCITTPPLDIIY